MILQSRCTSSLVACNIYITSAASAALPSLLSRAQDHCRQLRLRMQPQQQQLQHPDENDTRVSAASAAAAVVHAYADVPYDRSSFHLAGRSDCVAEVAIRLIQNALDEIELKNNNNDDDASLTADKDTSESRHPFVGLIDHVAVMPIACKEEDFVSMHSAAATAAREIGSNILQSNSINVHYYGLACPKNTPLATVRRRNTSFFNSGGAHDSIIGGNNNKPKALYEKGECTIGTPVYFVENYNIRLTPNVDFSTAKTLTQALRGRNIPTKGIGVHGVEALTLPYNRDVTHGGNVFEVACNLTEPKTGSVKKMEEELEKWIQQQKQQQHSTNDKDNNDQYYNRDYFIEKAYRVGTTEEQCLTVLKEGNDDDEYWMQYDQQVFSRFKGFLGQSVP